MFNIIKSLFRKRYFTGLLPDTRTPLEKGKDWLHEEVATKSRVIKFVTKNEADEQERYYNYDQKRTSSCVANALALQVNILTNLIGSPMFIYRNRSNYSGEGMIGENAGNILDKKGIPQYDLLPNTITESEANAIEITDELSREALKNSGYNYFSLQDKSYLNVADLVNQGKAVKIFIYATEQEWRQEWVDIKEKDLSIWEASVRHAIVVLPNTAFLYKGKYYVKIQDSAKFGGRTYRYVSEDFFNKRVYFAQYLVKKPETLPEVPKPKYTFTRNLTIGSTGADVKALQDILKYEKCFDYPTSTGLFYGYTRSGVKKLQEKYAKDILHPVGLTKGTGYVGKSTIAWLNKNYS